MIKFRMWDKNTNTMIYQDNQNYVINLDKNGLHLVETKHNEETTLTSNEIDFMQYTGLNDICNVEIYTDDILLITSDEGDFKAKVVYEKGTFGIVVINGRIIDYFPDNWNDDYMTLLELHWMYNNEDIIIEQVQVAGNTHENLNN